MWIFLEEKLWGGCKNFSVKFWQSFPHKRANLETSNPAHEKMGETFLQLLRQMKKNLAEYPPILLGEGVKDPKVEISHNLSRYF